MSTDDRLERIERKLDTLLSVRDILKIVKEIRRKGISMSVVMDQVRTEVANVRSGVDTISAAVAALAARLADNPTADEAAAVAVELAALAAGLPSITASIDSLAPDVPAGAIPPE